jgi:hypothetical protein
MLGKSRRTPDLARGRLLTIVDRKRKHGLIEMAGEGKIRATVQSPGKKDEGL